MSFIYNILSKYVRKTQHFDLFNYTMKIFTKRLMGE